MKITAPKLSGSTIAGTVVGLVVGAVVGLLLAHEFEADWFEAVGVWVGSAATVAAIIWAVHSFHAEREERVRQAVQTEVRAEAERQSRANSIKITTRGGGFYRNGDTKCYSGVVVRKVNGSPAAATDVEYEIRDVRLKATFSPGIIPSGTDDSVTIETEQFGLPCEPDAPGETDYHDLTDRTTVTFTFEGRRWRREGTAAPVEVGS